MKRVILNDLDYDRIIDCIRNCYEAYTGDSEIDHDVYEFNTDLDNLLLRIEHKTKEIS